MARPQLIVLRFSWVRDHLLLDLLLCCRKEERLLASLLLCVSDGRFLLVVERTFGFVLAFVSLRSRPLEAVRLRSPSPFQFLYVHSLCFLGHLRDVFFD